MPSKTQIEAELNRLRNDMEMLQINHDTARWEMQDMMKKRRDLESIINGGGSQSEKDSAQRQHDRLCTTLTDLCNRQELRCRELQRYRDKESELMRHLRSAT
jgi:chromosome segregation ATPase